MPADPVKSREFAVQVVRQLRDAGFEALWAGGCVRDQLLGREPKDYDVATLATPDQIREVFGKRRTLPIGAAFGVITVLGPKGAEQIEVATFRKDATYSDGRHPDSVAFSGAEEDALRRDFTINGLFFDPLADEVIDYVGGQDDLQKGVLRAIRDPEERIDEDKLRMLRAVRFAATLGFEVEASTMKAVQRHAFELVVVSAERIAEELRKILTHDNRRRGVDLLQWSGLLQTILPELDTSVASWPQTLDALDAVIQPTTAVAFALLLRSIHCERDESTEEVEQICRRWRLSNEEIKGVRFCLENDMLIRAAPVIPWPILQRVLIAARINELLRYSQAVEWVLEEGSPAIDFCAEKLALPPEQLNPPPLIDGDDLRTAGISPGPIFKKLLRQIRDAQLEGQISTREEAIELAKSLVGGDAS